MKANEFVKKFGWDRAKREVALIGTIAMMCGDNDFNNDLKRLVESHKLVESYGGLSKARNHVERTIFKLSCQIIALKKAIADVESCQ
ncbi:hypothetical protein [Acinetobacter indicus]|uniref:hypothetical protein n=1 Tax=Acinetobacter indicus TaxID=756892 RepID=UPI000948F852|nr:hypothetical protein [Acinetobacter indicus]